MFTFIKKEQKSILVFVVFLKSRRIKYLQRDRFIDIVVT